MNISRIFRRTARPAALVFSAVLAAPLCAQTTYVPVEQLWYFTAATAGQPDVGNWISASGDAIWLLHPEQGLVRRVKKSAGSRKDATREIRVESIALPPGLAKADLSGLDLTVASAASETWLVDHTGRRVWRHDATKWLGPWIIGEPIGNAAALPSGGLVVNTPAHSMNAFAVIGRDGTVSNRFGSRLQPWRFGMNEDWNRWALAVSADGRIIAAHHYSDRLRAYDARFNPLWETSAEFPAVEELRISAGEAESSIRVDPATCCYTAKLVRFASRVIALSESRFAVQFGVNASLEEFDRNGKWLSTLPLRHGEDGDVRLFGLAAAGDDLLGVTARGAARFQRIDERRLVEGVLLTADRQPVAKAVVSIGSASSAKLETLSDDAGKFSVVVANKSDWHDLTVSASGFRTWNRRGTLDDLLEKPIILSVPLNQCVRVTDQTTGQPVEKFELEIYREASDHKSASRTSGAREIVNSPGGTACLESPWEHPWAVKIAAEGYATEKVVVEQPAELDVSMKAGAILDVTLEDPAGSPVPGASLKLLKAVDSNRTVAMIEDEAQATTDQDGNARFLGFAPGSYQLEGTSDDVLSFVEPLTLELGVNTKRVKVKRGSVLRMRVVSKATGKDVEGAVVMAELLTGSTGRLLQCTTASDGRCAIPGVGPGRYQARARAQGLVEGQRPFNVAGDSGEVEVELRLEESVRLTGRVEGIAQYPGIALDVVGSKPGVPFLTAPLDSQGAFAFEEFPSGEVNLRVRERNRNSTLVYRRVTIPNGRATHDVTLRLPDALLLQGRIRHRETGCGACTLVLEGIGTGVDKSEVTAVVEPSGTYSARLPGRGSYVARVTAPDGAVDRRVLDISGPARENFDLDDRERTAVTVFDDRGAPVDGARVQAIDVARGVSLADVSTSSSGTASLPAFPTATRIIGSKDRAIGSFLHPGANGGRSVEIVIRQSGQMQLDLRDARTGGPVFRAQVRIRSSRTGVDAGSHVVSRSDDAPFVLAVEAGDPVDLIIKAPGYAFKTVYGIDGQNGVQRIDLIGGLTLGIRVGPNIRPCAFELIGAGRRPYALSVDFPLGPIPLTANEVIFNPVEPGAYVASLHACDGSVLRQDAVVRPGETTSLVVFDR